MSISSSPDPLVLPMDSSPVRGSQRRHSKGPLSSRSINITSPSKSMYLESKTGRDGSPWRIKVTVEAEHAEPEINRSIRTSKVAHKDSRRSSPVKRPARRSRKDAPAPVGDNISIHATPRRRKNSVQAGDLIEIPDDTTNDYSLSEIEPSTYNEKDAERSASNEIHDHHFPPTLVQSHSPSTTATTDKSVRHHDSSGEQPTTAKPESAVVRENTSPGFPPEEDWSEDEVENAVLGAQAPEDATVLEGEDFSMVSVDSLSSNVRYSDHPSPTLSSHHTKESANKLANMSYMPSSPPTYLPSYHRTPLPSDSPPKYPAAPVQSSVHHNHVETPLQESARKSGRALQDVLTGPHADSRPQELTTRDAVFNGFSTGTRRQLRESLYAGQSLATPPLPSQPNFGLGLTGAPHLAAPVPTFSSPFHSPVRRNSNSVTHRLPTPDEKAATSSRVVSSEPTVSGEVVYPSIAKKLEETPLASPYVEYDAMSWVATGATKATMPAIKSPLRPQTVTEEETLISSEVSREANGQLQSELQQDTPQHESPQQEEPEEAKDIWQEEASRSIDDDEDDATPPIFRDELYVKPRRAKLPGTWRRTSQANFHYSDSPEPEDVSTRKVSAATSASGIMTPPITEDERLTEGVMTPGEESESDAAEEEDSDESQDAEPAKERPDEDEARSTIRSNRSQKSNLSTETDDTGGFWQSNLPAVFNRPSNRRARTTISPDAALNLDLSVDESFSPGSPLRNTMLDFSPEKTGRTYEKREKVIGAIKRAPQSDSGLLPTPLRLSLLKSSKIRGSPGNSISLKNQDQGINESFSQDNSSSMASDARQLHNEFTQQLNATRNNSTIDLKQGPLSEHSETTLSVQSYVEELNRASPTKVRVNFNDSVADSAHNGYTHDSHGRSIVLSPKKQYPPLFDDAPSSKPSKGDGNAAAETASGRSRVRKGGFVSRLTDSFWDAVVTAPPPTDAKPTILISPSQSPAPAATECKQPVPSAISTAPSVPDHVLRLRRKYGLLPHVHPFTYQHIRTLHRMLNSARGMTSGTCIIPASGPLRADLASLVGQTKTNDLDQSFTWTQKYAHVVDGFMSLLLPAPERQRLVDHTTRDWGDEEALRYKGFDSKGRNGTDKVFPAELKGEIMSLWVASIMQDIVWKEEMNAKKRMIRDMLANVSKTEDSEMLQKVKPSR